MEKATFDELQQTLSSKGPAATIDRLCTRLRENKDYASLFYALLLKKRHELGVAPVPAGSAADLPEKVHSEYEDAIRDAGRQVGNLYLEEGNIPSAWNFFRMLGEPEPVAKALENYKPGEDEDCQQILEIALYQGAHPCRGFDMLLERHGICSAITAASGEMPYPPEVREHCVKRLVQALHLQLRERLQAAIAEKEGAEPAWTTMKEMLAGRDWLFADEFYHVDVSHLGAVVQMSVHLPPGEELGLARELSEYGTHLSPRLQYEGDPPFDDQYRDYGVFLSILAGDNVEDGLAHFRAKAENADPNIAGTFPAEVLVNLLLKLNRPEEALATARKFLAGARGQKLSCPTISDLCQRVNDYRPLVEVSREQDDPVNFVAGLIAAECNNTKH
jgi:hypothetical protein